MIKKLTLATLLFFSFFSSLFALNLSVNEDSVKAYREALVCFENQNYGQALKLCENAILFRKQLSQNHKKVLETSMSPRRVQRAGKEISAILAVLEERNEKEAIGIIKYYFSRKGENFFENSIDKLLSYIDEIQDFPEAQCLIGDIYLLEGEYIFAEKYYLEAIENSKVLDIPNQKYEILTKLARISYLQNDLNQMEVRLLSILTEDKTFSDKALFSAMMNTISSNKADSMQKFFQLYRSDTYYALEAYNKLFEYYYSLGNMEKSLQFALLSVLTNFSRMEDVVASRNIEYSYKDLQTLFFEVSLYPDILDWCNRNDVWKNFNNFSMVLIKCGYDKFAKSLLTVLAEFTPEAYWQKNAVILLSSIKD